MLIWVVSAETIQFIFRNEHFRAPFFLTYFNTSLFALYLLGFLFRPLWWGERGPPRVLFWLHWSCCSRAEHTTKDNEDQQDEDEKTNMSSSSDTALDFERFSVWKVVQIAFWFCPLWFGANYFYNLSLTLTSASSSSILSSTSSLFTLGLGLLMRVEKGSIWKLAGVLLTLAGVTLVSLVDTGSPVAESSWVGDVIALLGAFAYACYAVYLKVRIADERSLHMPMFFGFVGALNLLLFWPLGFFLDKIRLEPFAWPSSEVRRRMRRGRKKEKGRKRKKEMLTPKILKTVLFLFANGLIGTVVSDYLWVLALLLVSPVVATVALSLTIPLSLIADSIINPTMHFSVFYIVGAVLTIFGFVLVNTSSMRELTCGRFGSEQQ